MSGRRYGTVYPYTRARPAPPVMGTVVPHDNGVGFITETGEAGSVSRTPDYVQLWAPAETLAPVFRQRHVGELHCWEGHPIRWRPTAGAGGWRKQAGDVRLVVLGEPVSPYAFLAGLVAWRDWLVSEGAAPGSSLGASSVSLLKAKLTEPLWCRSGPHVPPVGFTFGGRSELGLRGRGVFGPAVNVDMQAAYAKTLSEARYGGKWFQWPRASAWRSQADRGRLVLVNARVSIPAGLPFGPLPGLLGGRRPTNPLQQLATPYPVGRRLQGTWVAEELAGAVDAGCRIHELIGVWVHLPVSVEQPFLPWWAAVERGRGLGDTIAATLAKQTGNALWGQFCINVRGSRSIRAWQRRRPVTEVVPGRGMRWPLAPELAECVCGQVRALLFKMLLDPAMVCVHTDGGWFDDGVELPDGWRVKARTEWLRVLGPQRLAYMDGGAWRYVVSGALPEDAERGFEDAWRECYVDRVGYVRDRADVAA